MPKELLICAGCNKPAHWLVQTSAGLWVGHCCVPEEMWKQYPGWKERDRRERERRDKRSALARRNFGLEVSA